MSELDLVSEAIAAAVQSRPELRSELENESLRTFLASIATGVDLPIILGVGATTGGAPSLNAAGGKRPGLRATAVSILAEVALAAVSGAAGAGFEQAFRRLTDDSAVIAERHQELNQESISFEKGSAFVYRNRVAPLFHSVAADMFLHPGDRLELIGHTSSEGDQRMNLQLGLQRAEAVKAAFCQLYPGLETRIVTRAEGEASARDVPRSEDQRVDIRLVAAIED